MRRDSCGAIVTLRRFADPSPLLLRAHSFHWRLILCLCQGSRADLCCRPCSAYCSHKPVLLRTRKIIVNQFHSCTDKAEAGVSGSQRKRDPMTAKEIIARLRERVDALVATGVPVDVVVWRHPGETEAEAIARYMRLQPKLATLPMGTITMHVVSWE